MHSITMLLLYSVAKPMKLGNVQLVIVESLRVPTQSACSENEHNTIQSNLKKCQTHIISHNLQKLPATKTAVQPINLTANYRQ